MHLHHYFDDNERDIDTALKHRPIEPRVLSMLRARRKVAVDTGGSVSQSMYTIHCNTSIGC